MRRNRLVSVIIPAYNEKDVIERLLVSLKNQSHKDIEVIVVDDASTDNTAQIAKKYTKKVFTRKHAERSIQRNFGAKKSSGEFLLFLDADMELSKDVIEECVSKFNTTKNCGAVVIPEQSVSTTFWGKVKSFERSFYNKEGDENTDAARFFPKKVFLEVGGYDESITGPEDWDLPETVKNIGYKIARIKSLIYHYERVPDPITLAKKKYYYGLKSHRYLKKQNVSIFSPKTIYFIRPVFYKNWKILLSHPILTVAMIVMMSFELIGGGMGFIQGKLQNK